MDVDSLGTEILSLNALPAIIHLYGDNAPRLHHLSADDCTQALANAIGWGKHNNRDINTTLMLVLTTRNLLNQNIRFIQTLELSHERFDVVIIDDGSSNSTVKYLRKRGYAVLSQHAFFGLTESWNKDYSFALVDDYKHSRFYNNNGLVLTDTILNTKEKDVSVTSHGDTDNMSPLLISTQNEHRSGIQRLIKTFHGQYAQHQLHDKNSTVLNDYYRDQQQESHIQFFDNLYAPFPSLAAACTCRRSSNNSRASTINTTCADSHIITIAMAISNPVKTPNAGDIFTAQELALQVQLQYRVRITFLHRGVNWYDLSGVDVLITFLDAYNLSYIQYGALDLIKVAWARNWFHRWMSRPWVGNFDLLLLSSGVAKRFFDNYINDQGGFPLKCTTRCPKNYPSTLRVKYRVPVEILRIATNPQKFSPFNSTASSPFLRANKISSPHINSPSSYNQNKVDYVFPGNFWNCSRDIMQHLQPRASSLAPYSGWVVGSGWEAALIRTWEWGTMPAGFGELLRPSVPYHRLQELYASTNVVLDDNNHVTKVWGSVNSRVFDALAVGVLVITNGTLYVVIY